MALRELRTEGDPLLRKTAKPIKEVNERIRILLDDMLETMYKDNGVGLAAPQVGILRRAIVIDVGEGSYKMVNPRIVEASEEQQLSIEGCLSIPGFNGTVRRPARVVCEYLDETGQTKRVEAQALFARCICHEIDHLDGILFRDRVEEVIDMESPTPEMVAYLQKNHLLPEDAAADGEEVE